MTHEDPLLRAGMQREEIVQLMHRTRQVNRFGDDDDDDDDDDEGRNSGGGFGSVEGDRIVHDDGYGKVKSALLLVNPQREGGRRAGDGRLRRCEVGIDRAIAELDLESDRFEVRNWYDGVNPRDVLEQHSELEPAEWRGIGDFRRAA